MSYNAVLYRIIAAPRNHTHPSALHGFPSPQDSVVGKILLNMGRGTALNTTQPIRVECGKKPADAQTNCQPEKKPCLYNVRKDPCEYHNIADDNPGENID